VIAVNEIGLYLPLRASWLRSRLQRRESPFGPHLGDYFCLVDSGRRLGQAVDEPGIGHTSHLH
jgi:hypothetical protein